MSDPAPINPDQPDTAPTTEATDDPRAIVARAHALSQAGQAREAGVLMHRVLARNPSNIEALGFLGTAAYQRGDYSVAIERFTAASRVLPDRTEPLTDLARTYMAAGRWPDALRTYARCLKLDPRHVEAWYRIGTLQQGYNKLETAIRCYRQALRIDPDHVKARFKLADALMAGGTTADAFDAYLKALTANPAVARAQHNLGRILLRRSQLDAALAAFQRAAALAPGDASILTSLGMVKLRLGHLQEAESDLIAAVTAEPDNVPAHFQLALVRQRLGRWTAAAESFERAATLDPKHTEARIGLALVWLRLGRFSEGWRAYEARFDRDNGPKWRPYDQPPWDGSPLAGRTLFVYPEQGLGDTLQFVRLLPRLTRHGGRVILEAQREISGLVSAMPGLTAVIDPGRKPTAFDVHAPLLSVPHLIDLRPDDIGNDVPYLSAPGTAPDGLKIPATGRLRVGLVWAGNPHHSQNDDRSYPLETLSPLFDVPGIDWYSLQAGPNAVDPLTVPFGDRLTDLTPSLHTFSDTAHALDGLDLLITVDTAAAHLAGAMGRPVWVMLSFVSDWRWMLDRPDSPWYPTLRLFRQATLGDRSAVVEDVRAALIADGPSLARGDPHIASGD